MCATKFQFTYNVLLNKQVTYLSCSCYTHINNLEVVAMLCSHESIFSERVYSISSRAGESSATRNSQGNER